MKTSEMLTYHNHDGESRSIRDCTLTVDQLDRHWIWSEKLQQNLVYKTKGRDNALLAAIDSLLFQIYLRDERIAKLQRVVNLAEQFSSDAFSRDLED